MNIDVYILHKMLEMEYRNIKLYKREVHHYQVEFIPGLESGFNIKRTINVLIIHLLRLYKKNHMYISIDGEKRIL